MKIVLREDVDHLGERGDIVRVAAGYARNYLLPKGLAYEATPGNLKTLQMQRRAWEARQAKEIDAARSFAQTIESKPVSVTKKAGESKTLYGSVTTSEIADLLAVEGVEVDRRKIQLRDPIKSIGEFEVPIRLHREVTATIRVTVLPEGGSEEEAPEAESEAAPAEPATDAPPDENEAVAVETAETTRAD